MRSVGSFVLGLALPSMAFAGSAVVWPTSGIVLDEGAERFALSVRLSAPPLGTDTVYVGADTGTFVNAGCWSDPNPEIAVECAPLAFTAADWAQPKTLWLYPNTDNGAFGPGTPIVDGDQDWSFAVKVFSAPPGFEGAVPVVVSGTTRDADVRGIFVYDLPKVVSETNGHTDATAWYDKPFVLTAQPAADVRVELTSSDATEGAINPGYGLFTFTPAGWSSAKSISLVTIDDPVFDGDREWSIVATFSSADPDWDGVVHEIPMLTLDDEGGGVRVAPQSGLVTSEDGALSDTFEVVLTAPPWRPLDLGAAPDDLEGVCSPETATFDEDDWDTPKTVTVTGVDDDRADGDVTWEVLVEDWTPSFALGPELFANGDFVDMVDGWTGSIGYGEDRFPDGQLTDASGAYAITQTVTGLEPGCEYQLTVDTEQLPVAGEAPPAVGPFLLRVAHQQVGVGSPASWASFWRPGPQTVAYVAQWPDTLFRLSISGQAPGRTQPYLVDSVSLKKWRCPTGFELLPPVAVEVTTLDDDTAGFSLGGEGTVSEGGSTASVSLGFASEPMAPVLVTLFVSDATEASLGVTTVMVDGTDWDALADVPVWGVDDAVLDGDVAFTVTAVTSSDDPAYDGLVDDVEFVNRDDDGAAVVFSDGTSDAPLVVSEAGAIDRFTLRLGARPAASVTVDLAVDDATEGTVAPAQVTIDPADWDEPVSIVVQGVDDDLVDGDVAFTVSATTTSADAAWDDLAVATVHALNRDDDTAGLWIRPSGDLGLLQTHEAAGADTLVVALQAAPTADVVVSLAVSDATEVAVAPAALTFTPANYATPQAVTVTGQEDDEVDGDVVFGVSATAASADDAYDGLVATATGINADADVAAPDCATCPAPDCSTCPAPDDPAGSCGCRAPVAPAGGLGWLLALSTLAWRRRR